MIFEDVRAIEVETADATHRMGTVRIRHGNGWGGTTTEVVTAATVVLQSLATRSDAIDADHVCIELVRGDAVADLEGDLLLVMPRECYCGAEPLTSKMSREWRSSAAWEWGPEPRGSP